MGYVLLTGGTGFIGSHTAAELLLAGRNVVLLDDLSNSEAGVAERIGRITGRRPPFVRADAADRRALRRWENPPKSPWPITATTWTRP